MPLRLVTDTAGSAWHVWHVTPDGLSVRSSVAVAPHYAARWLAFEQIKRAGHGPAEQRRLVPVPSDWATASDETVLALLAAALPVRSRARA